MAMARRRSFAPRKRVVNYTWTGFFTATTVTVAPQTKALIGTFTSPAGAQFDETIVRTRAAMSITSDQSSVAEDQVGALGLIKVNDIALALGATAIPGPLTDIADDGWFVYHPVAQRGLNAGNANPRYVVDSQAQRIIPDGFGVAVMYENGSTTFSTHLMLVIRLLARFRS